MKRRNAETGKLRRPVKRTKITEGMYGNSIVYLKLFMVWASVVLADYMLEFRVEYLWPCWMLAHSLHDSYKYQGLAFSIFFMCIALTSDLICFFFIPLQYLYVAASTYVWVQCVWYSFADKGICLPTVALCCFVVYVEGIWRAERFTPLALCRPLAAHCVGYPVVCLGFGVKSYVGGRLRIRRQRQVRQENEFYFQLLRDALPESAAEQNQQTQPSASAASNAATANGECPTGGAESQPAAAPDCRHLNGVKRRSDAHKAAAAHTNGTLPAPPAPAPTPPDDDHPKGGGKSSKSEKRDSSNGTAKEEKRKHKNKDRDNQTDSHKSTEISKEHIQKDVERDAHSTNTNTKETNNHNSVKNHRECNGVRDRELERMRERERERDRERERECREARECAEELKRVKAELAAARGAEAEARRAVAAAAATDRQRRVDYSQLKAAHAALQHKVSAWRGSERAALERRLGEERRARAAAEQQLRKASATPTGECESEWCRSRRGAAETEALTLRRELRRAHDKHEHMARELAHANDQVRSLESSEQDCGGGGARGGGGGDVTRLAEVCKALQERATHLQRALSAETRVKLDLLSALGDAKRHMHIQEGLISRQEKEIEELKAQMLAVMPSEYVSVNTMSKRRLQTSPLDPNASVYTPKQLCSDA